METLLNMRMHDVLLNIEDLVGPLVTVIIVLASLLGGMSKWIRKQSGQEDDENAEVLGDEYIIVEEDEQHGGRPVASHPEAGNPLIPIPMSTPQRPAARPAQPEPQYGHPPTMTPRPQPATPMPVPFPLPVPQGGRQPYPARVAQGHAPARRPAPPRPAEPARKSLGDSIDIDLPSEIRERDEGRPEPRAAGTTKSADRKQEQAEARDAYAIYDEWHFDLGQLSKIALRRAIVTNEILQPPLALRPPEDAR